MYATASGARFAIINDAKYRYFFFIFATNHSRTQTYTLILTSMLSRHDQCLYMQSDYGPLHDYGIIIITYYKPRIICVLPTCDIYIYIYIGFGPQSERSNSVINKYYGVKNIER